MTKENLLKYLKDPTYLQQVSYQELKTLVAEHPSSLSLRYLLAVKSKQENNSDFERQLAYLATYGFDRAHLFDVFNKKELPQEMEDILPQEDYLELKELSALERELKANPISRSNDLLFEMEAPISTIPSYKAPKMVTKEEMVPTEDEDFYVLNFDEELDSSVEQQVEREVLESRVEGNLAAIEDLFKDLEEDGVSADLSTEFVNNGTSKELALQETVKGGDFPNIPLEVLDTNRDLISKDSIIISSTSMQEVEQRAMSIEDAGQKSLIQATTSTDNEDQLEDAKTSEAITHIVTEIIPETTEETLVVNPIPKSSFSTWYDHAGDLTSFSGYDLVGFNSKGIINELSASEKELKIVEQVREEKIRIAKLQAERRTKINNSVSDVVKVNPVSKTSLEDAAILEIIPAETPPSEAQELTKKKKKKQKHILKEIKKEAETSFVFEEDIASETLAQLLVLQGHYSKARAMYEHLSLIFPEKSSLFAYEIQKIENLEDEVA